MDEPFSGIDIFSREQITDVFTSHLVEDRGVLITTHEIHDIEHLIDKVVLLDQGRSDEAVLCGGDAFQGRQVCCRCHERGVSGMNRYGKLLNWEIVDLANFMVDYW